MSITEPTPVAAPTPISEPTPASKAIQALIKSTFASVTVDQVLSDIIVSCIKRGAIASRISTNTQEYDDFVSAHQPVYPTIQGIDLNKFQSAVYSTIRANVYGDSLTEDPLPKLEGGDSDLNCNADCGHLHTVNSSDYFDCLDTCPPATALI